MNVTGWLSPEGKLTKFTGYNPEHTAYRLMVNHYGLRFSRNTIRYLQHKGWILVESYQISYLVDSPTVEQINWFENNRSALNSDQIRAFETLNNNLSHC